MDNPFFSSSPSPLQEIFHAKWQDRGIRFFVKRDDLLAPSPSDPFCGNKWRKLKYNLLHAQEQAIPRLLSFGGAYSNHIAALASAGKHFGFETIGIIRGEDVNNPTLARAKADGMRLRFISRTAYRTKTDSEFIAALRQEFGLFHLIPEGGSNVLSIPGCKELGEEIIQQSSPTISHIAIACGTGGTFSGILSGLPDTINLLGISVLKGGFMKKEVLNFLSTHQIMPAVNWQIFDDYHHGGYAKRSPALMDFINTFKTQHRIQLEPIYTGKLFYALYDLIDKDFFPTGSSIVGVHTGGLQGFTE